MSVQRWEDLLTATAGMDAMTQAGLLGRIAWHLAQHGALTVDDFRALAERQREQADDEPEWVKLRRRASSPAGLQAIKHGVTLRDPGDDPTLRA